jgi:hypothetical protein
MALAQPQPRTRPKRKRTWRKRRPGDPKHYSVTVGGEGHWQPSKSLRKLGYQNVRCGPDGAEAIAIAENVNRLARAQRAAIDARRLRRLSRNLMRRGTTRTRCSNNGALETPRNCSGFPGVGGARLKGV